MAAKHIGTDTGSVVNTQALNQTLSEEVQNLELRRRNLGAQYRNEPKAVITGSPMYRPYFGNNMPLSINGIAIYIPLDGQQYSVPESFAAVFNERIARVDEQIRVRTRMADVTQNAETYAGEKSLINKG